MRGPRVLLTALLVMLLSAIYSAPRTAQAQGSDCNLNLPPSFVKGMRGKLSAQGIAARLITIRRQVSSDSDAIGILRNDDTFTAQGESGCDDGMYWASIVTDKGLSGFVAESDRDDYFIEPTTREIYRFGHGKAYGVSWSPDSKLLAIGSTIGIWLYTDQLKEVRLLPSYDDGVRAVAWSPDGKWIASANGDVTVQLWDVASGKSLTLLHNLIRADRAESWDGSLSWSPDSTKFASAGLDGTVRIWDVKSEKQLTALYHDGPVYSVAWHPDGKRLASGGLHDVDQKSIGVIWIWDTERGIQLKTNSPKLESAIFPELATVNYVQWVASTDLVAIATERQTSADTFTWNTQTDEIDEIIIAQVGGSAGLSIRYSPDGTQLAGIADGAVWLEQAFGKAFVHGTPHNVEWSTNNHSIVVVYPNGEIRLTDMNLPLDVTTSEVPTLVTNQDFIEPSSLVWSVIGGNNAAIVGEQIVDIRTKNRVTPTPTTALTQTPSPLTATPIYIPYPIHEPSTGGGWGTFIYAIASSPDGEQDIVLEEYGGLSVYDKKTYAQTLILKVPENKIPYSPHLKAAWSSNGKYIAATDSDVAGQNYLAIWDASTAALKLLTTVDGEIPLWHADSSRILLASPPTVVNLSGNILLKLDAKMGEWMPDGQRIFTSDPDKKVFRIWDGNMGQLHQTIIGTLAQLTDNKRYGAFTGDQLVIQIWDLNKEIPLITLDGLTAPATVMAWQPDGKRLAVASQDNAIRIWDVTTGKLLQTIGAHRMAIQSIVWKPDGTQLYSTSSDGTLKLWDVR